MSQSERDDLILSKLECIEDMQKKVDKLCAIIFIDNDTGKHGLYSDNEATKMFQKDMMEEFGAFKSNQGSIEKKIDILGETLENAVEKLAEIALWKEGIQAAPKTAGKIVFYVAGFVGALSGIYVFVMKYIFGK